MFKLFQSILSRLPSDSVDLSARRDIFSRPKQVNSKDRTETLELPPSNPTTSTPACWETHRPKLTVQTCYLQHTHTPTFPHMFHERTPLLRSCCQIWCVPTTKRVWCPITGFMSWEENEKKGRVLKFSWRSKSLEERSATLFLRCIMHAPKFYEFLNLLYSDLSIKIYILGNKVIGT